MTTDRPGYIAGLRALADALETDDALPLPWHGGEGTSLSVFTDDKQEMQAYARLLGHVDKEVTDGGSYGFQIRGSLNSLSLLVYGDREQVCTRRVVGTREVTREVKDPEALAAVPTVTVTETVEDVEWDCGPLMAPATSAVSA